MLLIKKKAFARAGLIGNPSDGYFGKTISIIVRDFYATAVLYEWEDVDIVPTVEARSSFRSVRDLVRDVHLHGYYGGIRLIKATIKTFVEYCDRQGLQLHDRNFSVRVESNIPRQVGLAGSSAIIVATLRCLMEFYGVNVPLEVQPSLALSVEAELGIAAGLQDRVIQIYEGVVFMDFAKENMVQCQGFQCGRYETLDPSLLPPLYVAYSADVGEPTEILHNDLRSRFNRNDPEVVAAMKTFADLAQQARDALVNRQPEKLKSLMDQNFDLRRQICQLHAGQVEMVEVARRCGASAKFAGSGGAIIGTYDSESVYEKLCVELGKIGCKVIKPIITP